MTKITDANKEEYEVSLFTRFCYVDGHWSIKESNDYTKWRRYRIDEIDSQLRPAAKNFNVFATIQHFENLEHQENELQYNPIFFDLESPKQLEDKLELEEVQKDAISICQFFYELGVEEPLVRIWFSGNRGFHITICAKACGIQPSAKLTYIMKDVASFLQEYLHLSSVDLSVYSIRRMWRLPNSIHHKSGLFKKELYFHDLQNKTIKEIREYCKTPLEEPLFDPVEYHNVKSIPMAKDWFASFTSDFVHRENLIKLTPKSVLSEKKITPKCVLWLLSRKSVPVDGAGNKCVLTLASYYKDVDTPIKETIDVIAMWASQLDNISNAGDERAIRASVSSVIKSVYQGNYHFSCNFMRSLGDKGSIDNDIPCEFDLCSVAKAEDQEPAKAIVLHLSDASKAEFKGTQLETSVVICGKEHSPYIVPQKILLSCIPNDEQCKGCRLFEQHGKHQLFLTPKDKELIEMVGKSDKAIYGILLKKANVKKVKICNVNIRIEDSINIEEVFMSPKIDQSRFQKPFVTRTGYFMGHGLPTNQTFNIKCYTHAHPDTQFAVHSFDNAVPVSSNISEFCMTDDLKDRLKIFQVAKDQSVEEKIRDIHTDLETNIYKLRGRYLMAVAVDIVYHSCLSYIFDNEIRIRGWMECLIVGDTGQGKTALAKKLRDHYDIGEFIQGETATRTGLMYSIASESTRKFFLTWGALPLNDTGLVIIDEFKEVPKEDVEQMTQMRDDGVIIVRRLHQGITSSRVRLVLLSNSKTGKTISQYEYGCMAFYGKHEIFEKGEDVRRLDFGVIVQSGEVSNEEINKYEWPPVEHIYTSNLCNNLVLWCWTRKPEQIIISREIEEYICGNAMVFGNMYWPEIPLVEPADQRHKITRGSIAIAGRTFSTDDGKRLIVKKEHVDFFCHYLMQIYDTKAMGYQEWSETQIMTKTIDPQVKGAIKSEFLAMRKANELRNVLLRNQYLSRRMFEDELGYDKEESGDLFNWLSRHRLIAKASRSGYEKEPMFIEILREIPIQKPV